MQSKCCCLLACLFPASLLSDVHHSGDIPTPTKKGSSGSSNTELLCAAGSARQKLAHDCVQLSALPCPAHGKLCVQGSSNGLDFLVCVLRSTYMTELARLTKLMT